ncbi:MAG: molybdenum cofactor guanylyltransferase [Chloroflexi bacterium]|nr:molybdenum cofactor guanylyltransferase [Chloroflexota bacterium]
MTKHGIIGAVLAGGRGRRIGRDKAMVELDGRPLISYPVGALRSAGLDVVLALRGGQEAPAGLEDVSVVRDEFEDAGPLGGLHALLKWMPGEWVLVVSCDQPFVRVNLLHGIISHSECAADAVVARTPERLQPMPGLYRKSCLPVVDGALRRGEHGMRDVLNGLPRYELAGEDLDCLDLEHSSFVNVNTPKDLLRARRLASSL